MLRIFSILYSLGPAEVGRVADWSADKEEWASTLLSGVDLSVPTLTSPKPAREGQGQL